MKKTLTFALALIGLGLALSSTPRQAEAQPLGQYCCDSWGYRRCIIDPSPVGTICFCYGQGSGTVCF